MIDVNGRRRGSHRCGSRCHDGRSRVAGAEHPKFAKMRSQQIVNRDTVVRRSTRNSVADAGDGAIENAVGVGQAQLFLEKIFADAVGFVLVGEGDQRSVTALQRDAAIAHDRGDDAVVGIGCKFLDIACPVIGHGAVLPLGDRPRNRRRRAVLGRENPATMYTLSQASRDRRASKYAVHHRLSRSRFDTHRRGR